MSRPSSHSLASQNPVTNSIQNKLYEQIERIEHLIGLIPPDKVAWNPDLPHKSGSRGSTDFGHLLGHLLDCLAGFCAVLHAAFPREMARLADLRTLNVNHFSPPAETLERIREYVRHLDAGFGVCCDADLGRTIPSVFVPEGETVTTLLLGNLEHLISHKYQLFMYLKLLGVPVSTQDIYHWRGTDTRTAVAMKD